MNKKKVYQKTFASESMIDVDISSNEFREKNNVIASHTHVVAGEELIHFVCICFYEKD